MCAHTHTQIYEYVNNVLYLNPGEVCARDSGFSTCMTLDIEKEKYVVTLYFRKIGEDEWKSKVKEFIIPQGNK